MDQLRSLSSESNCFILYDNILSTELEKRETVLKTWKLYSHLLEKLVPCELPDVPPSRICALTWGPRWGLCQRREATHHRPEPGHSRVCLCVHLCVHVLMCARTCMHVPVCTPMRTCLCARVSVYTHVPVCACMCVHVSVYTHVPVCACMCVHVSVYTHVPVCVHAGVCVSVRRRVFVCACVCMCMCTLCGLLFTPFQLALEEPRGTPGNQPLSAAFTFFR